MGFKIAGVALLLFTVLILAIRGTDLFSMDKKKIGLTGIVFGIVAVAAGGAWADLANGIHDIPASALKSGSEAGMPDPGPSATAGFLLLVTFGPRWTKLIWPALLAIASGVALGLAGGYPEIIATLIRSLIVNTLG
ncbi:hypothetical protein ACFXJO_16580 [Streptomyces lavendulae]|uniref:hypothetical protein n=1 Tax=Streptomyces lavendulae TaxID=1914 RepID=UPI0036BD5DAB